MDSSPTLLFSYLLSCCSIFFILSFCSFAFQVLFSLEMLVFVKSVPSLLFKRSLFLFVHCAKWCWNRLFCEENYVILHWWDNSSANRDAFFYSLGIRFTIFPVFLAVTVCLLFFNISFEIVWLLTSCSVITHVNLFLSSFSFLWLHQALPLPIFFFLLFSLDHLLFFFFFPLLLLPFLLRIERSPSTAQSPSPL